MSFANFRKENRCPVCAGSEKHTIEYVKKYFAQFNYTCLEDTYINGTIKMRYLCDKNHQSEIAFLKFHNNDSRCPVCAGNIKLTIDYVKDYFKKYNYTCLEEIYINSRTKMRFICDKGHHSSMQFDSFKNAHNRCSKCKNKTEQIVNKFLKDNYTNIVFQPRFEWCKNKKCLPFDFLLDDLKLFVEVDGNQHFKQIMNWYTPQKNQKIDIFKMKSTLDHGYSIIRISQEDIYKDNIDWQELLKNNIKKYDNPNCIYISKTLELYDSHKNLMKIL